MEVKILKRDYIKLIYRKIIGEQIQERLFGLLVKTTGAAVKTMQYTATNLFPAGPPNRQELGVRTGRLPVVLLVNQWINKSIHLDDWNLH
jgi:hypothetical protein